MDNSFLAALDNIKNADEQTVVAKVLAMFLKINTMGKEEVIATYQTYWFFRQHMKNVGDVDSYRLGKIHEALLNRMFAICCEPKDRGERARLAELMGRIAGSGIYYSMMLRAVDGHKPKY